MADWHRLVGVLTYLTPRGEKLYLVADPPPATAVASAAPAPTAAATPVSVDFLTQVAAAE